MVIVWLAIFRKIQSGMKPLIPCWRHSPYFAFKWNATRDPCLLNNNHQRHPDTQTQKKRIAGVLCPFEPQTGFICSGKLRGLSNMMNLAICSVLLQCSAVWDTPPPHTHTLMISYCYACPACTHTFNTLKCVSTFTVQVCEMSDMSEWLCLLNTHQMRYLWFLHLFFLCVMWSPKPLQLAFISNKLVEV